MWCMDEVGMARVCAPQGPASPSAGAVALVLPENHRAIVPGRRKREAVGAEAHDVDRLRPERGVG